MELHRGDFLHATHAHPAEPIPGQLVVIGVIICRFNLHPLDPERCCPLSLISLFALPHAYRSNTVQLICRQLQQLARTIQQFEEQISQTFGQHPDREIFTSLPGAGPVLAPRLLAVCGAERDRFGRATNLQCYAGIAPVTKQSGKMRHVHRRYLCPKFERQSFHEYAKESILWSRWAAAYYLQQRTKGSPHHTAVRALAYKWQRIIWRCWQSHTPYQEQIYEAALRKNGSNLVNLFEQIEVGKSPVNNSRKESKKTTPEKI